MTVVSPKFRLGPTGDCTPAKSSFRELDDAFLQTQTRIWLGEVLEIRFDEEASICDILADGELLFELSEVLSRMLPTLSADTAQSKTNELRTSSSSKSTRRYMPYYNVGSFLKMCKSLGLNGIDLFSPSDVVEKRNTRKVCMCIRSLSKKARSRELNVPDFDNVTRTLTMPTDMVECIRKSLEMSQCSSSLSAGQVTEKISKRMSNSASTISTGHSSDISDDAESSLMVADTNGHSDYAYDVVSPDLSCSEVVKDFSSAPILDRIHLGHEEDDLCEYLSPSNVESVGSPCSHYFSDQESSMSATCLGSRISGEVEIVSEAKYKNGDLNLVPIDWEDSHLDVGNLNDGRASNDHNEEANYVSLIQVDTETASNIQYEHLTYTPETDHAQSSCNSGEQISCTSSMSLEGRGKGSNYKYELEDDCVADGCYDDLMSSPEDEHSNINTARRELIGRESHSDGVSNELPGPTSIATENLDISSHGENHGSPSCAEAIIVEENSSCDGLNNGISVNLPDRMRNQIEHPVCPVDQNAHGSKCSGSLAFTSKSIDHHIIPRPSGERGPSGIDDNIVSAELDQSPTENDKEVKDSNVITFDHSQEHSDTDFVVGDAINSIDMPHRSQAMMGLTEDNLESSEKNSQENTDRKALDANNNVGSVYNDDSDIASSFTSSLDDLLVGAESPGSVEHKAHNHQQLAESMNNLEHPQKEDARKETPQPKPQRKLLKSVAKGTALLGIAVFLLHLRKNRQENSSKLKKQPTEAPERSSLPQRSSLLASSQKGQRGGNKSSVYPSEKLKFGF